MRTAFLTTDSRPKAYGAPGALRNLAAVFAFLVLTACASASPLKVVAFGDSLTQGYGLVEREGFVPQLQSWLSENLDEDVVVINAGVSGDTTAGGLARIGWALGEGADAVIVELGGNDLLRGLDPAQTRANLDGILAEITGRGVPVLLAGLTAPGNYGAEYKASFAAIFPDLAAKYGAILYPDFFAGLGDPGDASSMARYLQKDGIHPTAEGVRLIVMGIGPSVRELLARAR
ncbi:MAG: arylesterase [Paracoccaceae bacterium]